MTYDPNRYILGTWGEFVEVERRPVVAPGTKALTKQQLAERRAARERARPPAGLNPVAQIGQLLGGGRVATTVTLPAPSQSLGGGTYTLIEPVRAQPKFDPAHQHSVATPSTQGRVRTASDVAAHPLVRAAKINVCQMLDHVMLTDRSGTTYQTAVLSADSLGAAPEVFEARLSSLVEGLRQARNRAEYQAWLAKMNEKQAAIQRQMLATTGLQSVQIVGTAVSSTPTYLTVQAMPLNCYNSLNVLHGET